MIVSDNHIWVCCYISPNFSLNNNHRLIQQSMNRKLDKILELLKEERATEGVSIEKRRAEQTMEHACWDCIH